MFASFSGASLASAQTSLSAEDPGPEARARLQLGTVLYEEGRFAEAAAQFERAHATSGHPAMIYNAFLCHRQADQPHDALRTLDMYLATGAATPEERTGLQAQRDALASLVAALPEPADPPDATNPETNESTAPAPAPAPASAVAERQGPELTGPAVLLGAGAAVLVGAAVTGGLVVASDASLAERCPGGRCPDDAEGDIASGQTLAVVTDVLWISGAALATAGLVWLLVALAEGDVDQVAQCRGAPCWEGRF